MDLSKAKIFVAGHTGVVGSAIVRKLQKEGATKLLLKTSKDLDLRNQAQVEAFFAKERPEVVFLAAAKVGGIHANNSYPAEFIHDNLAIQTNIIHSAWKNGTEKLVFLGSSCIYPKHAPQPMKEEHLLTGELEPTNEWYAIAKIAGIKMCQAYRRQYNFDAISLMPTNLYGPGDNFHPENSHVLPALIRRFHEAKEQGAEKVTIWGTGTPKREFLHVDDLAAAAVHMSKHYSDEQFVNIGTGKDITIAELAQLIAEVIGYKGQIETDQTKSDGTPRKLLDASRANDMGWHAKISLREGVEQTYRWYRAKGV